MKKFANGFLATLTALALLTCVLLTPATFCAALAEEAPAVSAETEAAAPPPAEAPEAGTEAPTAAPTDTPEPAAEATPEQTETPAPQEAAAPAAEPVQAYTLTVQYVDESGALLKTGAGLPENPVAVTLPAGANYVVALPEIAGYRCTVEQLLVDEIAQDQTVTVAYAQAQAADAPAQPEDAATVKVDDHLAGQPVPEGPYVTVRADTGADATLGGQVTLLAQLHGFGGLQVRYQWQRLEGDDWVDVKGATASQYTVQKLDASAFGDWRVLVSVTD